MKIRTTKYIIKEGFLNTYRNKLMSLASVSIVITSLFIFGIFYLIIIDISSNMKGLRQQPEIVVFCDPQLNDPQVEQVEDAVKSYGAVEKYIKVTKKEAFEKLKKMIDNQDNLLEGLDESFLPVSFSVKLKEGEDVNSVAVQFEKIGGVEKVQYPKQLIDFIEKMSYWTKLVSTFLIIILLVISIFIISNTIKLTVFARRKEINIMKYIGATDWFIRWPFVIEGIVIGIAGAVVAFVLVGYAYNAIEEKISSDLLANSYDFVRMVKMKEVAPQLIAIYCIIGTVVGALGSLISIRKYLRV